MHIHNMSLQVSLQVASVATITAFEVFQLKIEAFKRDLKQQVVLEQINYLILKYLGFDQHYVCMISPNIT